MTSHTETTSKVTETINSIDYSTGWQYSVTGTNVNNGTQVLPPSTTNNVTDKSSRRNRRNSNTTSSANWIELLQLHNNRPQKKHSSLRQTYKGPGVTNQTVIQRNNRGTKRNRYHKYLYPIIGLLIASPSVLLMWEVFLRLLIQSQYSSFSVTNQVIQVLQRSIYNQHLWWRNQLSRSHRKYYTIHYSC